MNKYPILFESNSVAFNNHGLGILSDAIQCDVTEELNGIFELSMVYPSSGERFGDLKNGRIIYADASKELGFQPFRIVRINKLSSGIVNVYAQHISYDLGGIQLPPFKTLGTADGMSKIPLYSTSNNPFVFQTIVTTDEADENKHFFTETPKSVRSYLMGAKESFLQAYGGEFLFNGFGVTHAMRRGADKGYTVKYGVNLVDLNQEESIEETYTGIYPYYKSEYVFIDLTENVSWEEFPYRTPDASQMEGKILYANGQFGHVKIASVDISSRFTGGDPFSISEVREEAEKYMEENQIGIPRVSLDLRFEHLKRFAEFSNISGPDDVSLGDTIHVQFVKLGVNAEARINTVVYDSLRHVNKRVAIGDVKNTVADTIVKSINTQKVNQSIDGDKINMFGYVTFNSLGKNGTTEIDGGRIKTGQIRSNGFANDKKVLIKSTDQTYSAGKCYFYSLQDGETKIYFETKKDIPKGGKIVYIESEHSICTYSADGSLIEKTVCRAEEYDDEWYYAQYIDVEYSAYMSDEGTMIDLESGEFISKNFAIRKGGEAYFDGAIRSSDAVLGGYGFTDNGFGRLDGYVDLGNGEVGRSSIFYDGRLLLQLLSSNSMDSVFVTLGDFFSPKLDFKIGSQKATDSGYVDAYEMIVSPDQASLKGGWKSTPYTDTSKDPSEIVTKQDLIALGLIQA